MAKRKRSKPVFEMTFIMPDLKDLFNNKKPKKKKGRTKK